MNLAKDLIESLANGSDFFAWIAKYGESFTAAPLPDGMRRMRPRECFANATSLVLHGRMGMGYDTLRYVEGWCVGVHGIAVPIHHAFCVTPDGVVVDPTWRKPEECHYFGIVIPTDYLCRHLMKTKTYGVFDWGIPRGWMESGPVFDAELV